MPYKFSESAGVALLRYIFLYRIADMNQMGAAVFIMAETALCFVVFICATEYRAYALRFNYSDWD